MKRIITVITTLALLLPSVARAEDGDLRKATIGGLEWTYRVLSEADKTCQIGNGGDGGVAAIAKTTEGPLTIPTEIEGYTVTTLGDYCFSGCRKLTGDLVVPTSVTVVKDRAFENCSSLDGTLQLHDGITRIGKFAFYECKKLKGQVTFPASLSAIENGVYYGCASLTGSLVIPDRFTSIAPYAFQRCYGLDGKLQIPASITRIGNYAFAGAYNFSEVEVSPQNTVYDSRDGSNCIIVTATGELLQGFNCSTIPASGITSIGAQAFYNCNGMTQQLVIPEGVTEIGGQAFAYIFPSNTVGTVSFPTTLKAIGDRAFQDSPISEVLLPEGLETIGENAFSGSFFYCTKLSIPSTVKAIGKYAFNWSGEIQRDIYTYIQQPFEIHAFGDFDYGGPTIYNQTTLHVPTGTLSLYAEIDEWKRFLNIVEFDATTAIDATTSSDGAAERDRYTLSGQRTAAPTRGVNIVRTKDGRVRKVIAK